jgi:ubiquinone/menaquinone biosynthesis C-methylase UbiE
MGRVFLKRPLQVNVKNFIKGLIPPLMWNLVKLILSISTYKAILKAIVPPFLFQLLKKLLYLGKDPDDMEGENRLLRSQEFWTGHNVTFHRKFNSAEESLRNFRLRCVKYIDYLTLMPVDKADGKVILDYGCGPGHDLVGIAHYSKPERIIAMDVSSPSLDEARERIALHHKDVDFILIHEDDERLPLEDESVDIIHCSGVLHHTPDPVKILKEFRRILKSDGYAQVMVYNYDSIFMHLYTAYIVQTDQVLLANLDKRKAFSKLTDTRSCPISECYTTEEFTTIVNRAGLACTYKGASISLFEMNLLPRRFDAIQNDALNDESRDFLLELLFDKDGKPIYRGHVAGIDGCYILRKTDR